jgi:hypothetical protein
VPVQHVELGVRQRVHHPAKHRQRQEVAASVHHESPVREARRVRNGPRRPPHSVVGGGTLVRSHAGGGFAAWLACWQAGAGSAEVEGDELGQRLQRAEGAVHALRCDRDLGGAVGWHEEGVALVGLELCVARGAWW